MAKSLLQNRVIGVSFGIALAFLAAHAGYLGGQPGAFLRTSIGAASLAMGGTGVADPLYGSVLFNPAAVVDVRGKRCAIGSGLREMGRADGYVSFETRVPPRAAVSLALVYQGDPFLDKLYDEQEYLLPKRSYTVLMLKGGLGILVNRKLSLGASMSAYYQNMPVDLLATMGESVSLGAVDLSARWRFSDKTVFGFALRNLGAKIDWPFSVEGFTTSSEATQVPISLCAGVKHTRLLGGKELVVMADALGYVTGVERKTVVLNAGAQWQLRPQFCVRAGIGSLSVDSDLWEASNNYFYQMNPRVTAGFGLDATKYCKGLLINYALASGRAWPGVDQTIDCVFTF